MAYTCSGVLVLLLVSVSHLRRKVSWHRAIARRTLCVTAVGGVSRCSLAWAWLELELGLSLAWLELCLSLAWLELGLS